MTLDFNALSTDFRLYDLFGLPENFSATQLWTMEIQRKDSREVRFLYARALPSTFRSDRWTGTATSNTPLDDNSSVRIHALTLHTSADKLGVFLREFFQGRSLEESSLEAGLNLDAKISRSARQVLFGTGTTVRPVMHFPARDVYFYDSKRLSPTSYASADSGAVSSESKPALFSSPEEFERKLAKAACDAMDGDTGMEFATLDAWRLGDFEFVCAPGLTKSERRKFDLQLQGEKSTLRLSFPLTREPGELLVVISAFSDGGMHATHTTRLDGSVEYPMEHVFDIDTFKSQVATAYAMTIYAVGRSGAESYPLVQIGSYFCRTMGMTMQVVHSIRSEGRMDWLARQVPKKLEAKLQASGQVGRSTRPDRSMIGGHIDDPWVSENRRIEDDIHSILPNSSAGRFFPTLSASGGTSRLLISDWLRKIFERHHDAQVAWIDPFMENVGIDLLNTLGTATSEYLIITTEKQSSEDANAEPGQLTRIEKLLASCAAWGKGYFGNVKLRVLAVPESKIHDRMILVRGANNRPVAGYHLSNSIQRANLQFPLLATPIPLDVLSEVFELTDNIIQGTLHDTKTAPTAKLIFDSSVDCPEEHNNPDRLSQRSTFTDPPRAGDVLAWWLDDAELCGHSGESLRALIDAKGLTVNGKLDPERFRVIPSKLWEGGFPVPDFHSAWDAVGFVLAHSQAGQLYDGEFKTLPQRLELDLIGHLNSTRADALLPRPKKSHIDFEHYRSKTYTALLLSNDQPDRLFSHKPIEIAWGDYYALKILWRTAPATLAQWLGIECASTIQPGSRSQALVVQALRLICLSLGFTKEPTQMTALLSSQSSVLKWVGAHALKNWIIEGTCMEDKLSMLELIYPPERQTTLCWLINEANYAGSVARTALIAKLTASLTTPVNDAQLSEILQPVRGRLGRLHHFTPWILESLIIPMLKLKVIDPAQVSRQWLGDLTVQWKDAAKGGSLHFSYEGDGAFTDELAALCSLLEPADLTYVLDELTKAFNSAARTVRLPFSAQVDWSSYIRAHETNVWLCALARRIAALIHTEEHQPLSQLIADSSLLIGRLSVEEWETLANQELFKYSTEDPDQIRSHRLLDSIRSALTGRR